MFEKIDILKIKTDDLSVGRMVLSDNNLCVFEYSDEFLSGGFSISPFYLPLRKGVFTSRYEPFGGVFGVFNDSLPDGWGRLLIDRYIRTKGINPEKITVLDRLAIVGSNGMGALNYYPDHHIDIPTENDDLDFIYDEVRKILSEQGDIVDIERIAAKGGSSGGARPKVFIRYNNESWIVKFRSSFDPENIGETEYLYSLIARKCGIEMEETELLSGRYFATKRFDREGEKKIHMHSASGLLYADFRIPSLDYTDLIKAVFVLTKSMKEVYKLFRLMVFNVLTGNKDDHSKNFSFLFKEGKWVLSPAYDLVPSKGINGNHTTTVNGKGNPNYEDIISVVGNTGIDIKIAKEIYEDVYYNCKEIRIKDL